MSQSLIASTKAYAGVYLKAKEGVETLTEYKGKKGKFIKTFALNDLRNKNGWRAIWEGIKNNLHTFHGRPGIEFVKCDSDGCDLDHTEAQTKELSLEIQEPYRVTTIIDHVIDEANHTSYFIHECHDDAFWEKVKSQEVKFVSPSLWPKSGGFEVIGTMENGAPKIDVWEWDGLHDAFVNKPAFGDDAKITATCEGDNCPVKLLSAKSSKNAEFQYVAGVVEDCVSKKISEFYDKGETPDKQKLAIFFSECRKEMTASDSNLVNNISHLQEIPLLVNHNKKKNFISVSKDAYTAISAALSAGEKMDEGKVFDIIRQEPKLSSFSSCTCSSKHNMSPEEEKELKSKLKAAEDDKKELESKFKAQEDDDKKDHSARVARITASMKAMDDDTKKEYVASVKASEDEKEIKAAEEAEKEVKTAKKATEENPEIKAVIASNKLMEDELKSPLITIILQAREVQGADKADLETLSAALHAKSLKAVKEKFAEDKIFIENALAATENEVPEQKHFAFSGSSQATQLSAKSLEETFEEVVA